jgi:hypothetical protein
MNIQSDCNNLYKGKKVSLVIAALMLYSAACSNIRSTAIPAMTTIEVPTATPKLPPTLSLPSATPLATLTPLPPSSTWKEGWVDFINGYYGYAISVPPSAEIHKNEGVDGYDPNEVPADWNEKDSYFDYLNMLYPPGLCVTIELETMSLQIKVADWLGGKYVDCAYIGGLGEETNFVWDWTEEDVIVGDKSYTATGLRQCESHTPNAKCGEGLVYTITLEDKTSILFSPKTDVILEILRTYRPAPRTEVYCPNPAITRLSTGAFAYISVDPPLKYNNVRSAPGINKPLIGSIAPGKAVELLEGPVCNNSLQWWKVRVLKTDLIGWTPEGDHDTFWLVPCESEENCEKP